MSVRMNLIVALAALAVAANAHYTANVFIVNLTGEEMTFGGCATSVNGTLPVKPQTIPVDQVSWRSWRSWPACLAAGRRGLRLPPEHREKLPTLFTPPPCPALSRPTGHPPLHQHHRDL